MLLHARKLLARALDFGRSLLLPLLVFHLLEFIGLAIFAINFKPPENRCFVGGVLPSALESGADQLTSSLEDITLSHDKPIAGKTIFFHVSRCYHRDPQYTLSMTARQACAIESAALHNPHLQVFVLFESPTYLPDDARSDHAHVEAVLGYTNVFLRQVNLWRFAEKSPIESWVKKADLLDLNFLSASTSNLLRFLSLYHFGGIYLNIDSLVLRSLENVSLNYVGAYDNGTLENAVLSLDPVGLGHKLAHKFLLDIQQNYNEERYENIVTRICGSMQVKKDLEDSKRCPGLSVFNSSEFLAVPSEKAYSVLGPNGLEILAENSYVIHSWNAKSNKCHLKSGNSAAYVNFAKKHCPSVYEAVSQHF